MLMGRLSRAALPAMDRVEIGMVNSRESKRTESFWVSLKRSLVPVSSASTT